MDPRFGTLGDFVEFTHQASSFGIRVIVDLVVNHTSDEHPWFQAARSDPNSKYRNYYVWSEKKPDNITSGCRLPRLPGHHLVLRQAGEAVVLPSLLRLPARSELRQPRGAGGDPQDHGLLAPDGGLRLPGGRGALPHRDQGTGQGRGGGEGLRLPAGLSPVPDLAIAGRHRAGRGERGAGRADQVLRGRGPDADAAELHGEPAPVQLPGPGERHSADARPGIHSEAPGKLPVGLLPAEPRRDRPGQADRRGAAGGLREVRARPEHAAVRPGGPPPAGPHAGQRRAAAGAGLQPHVHPARHAGAALRRGDRHGGRPLPAGAKRHPHPHAVGRRAQRRLLHGAPRASCCAPSSAAGSTGTRR